MAKVRTILTEIPHTMDREGEEVSIAEDHWLADFISATVAPRRTPQVPSPEEEFSPREPYGFD